MKNIIFISLLFPYLLFSNNSIKINSKEINNKIEKKENKYSCKDRIPVKYKKIDENQKQDNYKLSEYKNNKARFICIDFPNSINDDYFWVIQYCKYEGDCNEFYYLTKETLEAMTKEEIEKYKNNFAEDYSIILMSISLKELENFKKAMLNGGTFNYGRKKCEGTVSVKISENHAFFKAPHDGDLYAISLDELRKYFK